MPKKYHFVTVRQTMKMQSNDLDAAVTIEMNEAARDGWSVDSVTGLSAAAGVGILFSRDTE